MGILAFSRKLLWSWVQEKKKCWHLKSKFCPNSAVFAETILIWHISSSLRVPKSLSRSTYHRRWLMLCLLCLKSEFLLIQYEQILDHTHETTRHTARQKFTAKKYHVQMRDGRKKAKSKISFPKITCNLKLSQKLKLNETACEKNIWLIIVIFLQHSEIFCHVRWEKIKCWKNLSSFHKSPVLFCWVLQVVTWAQGRWEQLGHDPLLARSCNFQQRAWYHCTSNRTPSSSHWTRAPKCKLKNCV